MLMKCLIKASLCLLILKSSIGVARVFKIAGIPEAPLRYYDDNKKLKGIDIEIIELIFGKLKIPYKVILLESSPGLKKIYEEKSADMVLSFSKTPERQKYLDFSDEPHLSLDWYFFALAANKGKYKFDDFTDLKGARVGVTHGFAYTIDFWNVIDKGTVKPVFEHRNSLQIHNLFKNKVDLVLLNRLVAVHHAKKLNGQHKITQLNKPVKSSLYYNGFVRNSSYPKIEELKIAYDKILKQAKSEGFVSGLLKKYGG